MAGLEGGGVSDHVTSAVPKPGGAGEEKKDEELEPVHVEQPLLTIKEVFVYRVPPLRAASGHRAEEWGLANPVFTGTLRMVQVGDVCCIRLFSPPPEAELGAEPTLFAECPVRPGPGVAGGGSALGGGLGGYVEAVIDSSRYFVLRCEDQKSGRHAFVGIGFRERSSAFDLKASLDDFVRFIERQHKAEQLSEASAVGADAENGGGAASGGEEEGTGKAVRQMRDLSIAEGQKLHLHLKGTPAEGASRQRRHRGEAATSGGASLFFVPPPPPPGALFHPHSATSAGKGGEAAANTPALASADFGGGTAPPLPPLSPGAADSDVTGGAVGVAGGGSAGDPSAAAAAAGEPEEDGWGDFESAG